MPNIGDIIKYLREEDKLFREWKTLTLIDTLCDSLDDGTLVISVDHANKINGVVVGTKRNGCIHIIGIQADDSEILKSFIRYYQEHFQGTRLTAIRDGKFIEYDTPRLCHKILNIT